MIGWEEVWTVIANPPKTFLSLEFKRLIFSHPFAVPSFPKYNASILTDYVENEIGVIKE